MRLNNLYIVALSLIMCLAVSTSVHAEKAPNFRPVLIYDKGTKEQENGFLTMMHRGVTRAQEDLNLQVQEQAVADNEDRLAVLKSLCENGATHIIAVGYQNVVPVLSLAEHYKDIKFTVIDGLVPPLFPNVQSIIFKDHEGAFLMGMIAAKTSNNHSIGFIGGIDAPIIKNFAQGFTQGAQFVRKDIRITIDYIGKDNTAWNEPERANILAKKQYYGGVDVIFAAAGASSVGVLQAASEVGKYAIGVDVNQNVLYPRSVLTSMVKRVDNAVFETLSNDYSGKWTSGTHYLGIRENALDYAVDINNKDIISETTIEEVEVAKDRIARGLLNVSSYKEE